MINQDRIDEINAEMQAMNDAFSVDNAVDFEYVTKYHNKMMALSKELLPLLEDIE